MGCWKQFVWQPHLSLVTPVVLHPKNPLGGRRSYDTAAISARPKILRFLLGLRRSSSCGRDCADGLLEAVCMATAFISRDPGLTAPQKSVGGAQELRHRSHFGKAKDFAVFARPAAQQLLRQRLR